MKRNILYLILPALLFAACDRDEAGDLNPAAHGGEPIRFEIGFAGGDGPQTRAATDADFKTTWEAGDRVGLYIVKGSGGLQSSGNWVDNLPMTRQSDGTWNYTLPAGCEYYPGSGDALHFYAYYPYNAGPTDPTAYTFSAAADQSAETDYNASDLLLAKAENVSRSGNAVSLQFAHALSLVQIEVKREVNVPLFNDADFTVTLTNVLTDAALGWNSTLTGTGKPADIVMHKVDGMEYTYRALMPAQTLAGNAKVTFTQTTTGSEIDMWYNGLQSVVLTAGATHKHRVTLGWGIDPDHVYAVGDEYPHVGPVMGIVYEISNEGKNGKVVGLMENSGVAWSDSYGYTGATDQNNGRVNMRTIYTLSNDFSGYPAFSWVHDLNPANVDYNDASATDIWYLPAVNELTALYNVMATVNTALASGGGTALNPVWYWSSSEDANYAALVVAFSGGFTDGGYKHYDFYGARCVLAF